MTDYPTTTITEAFLENIQTGLGPVKLYSRCWTPTQPAKAVVLIVHGLGEHCQRYNHVARNLNTRGYRVYALDHLGHGKSDGHRVFVDRFNDYHTGVTALYEKAKAENSAVPIFIIGHSMGGLITATWLLEHQAKIKACVLSGPAIKASEEPNIITRFIGNFLSRFFPKTGLLALDATSVSRDKSVVDTYLSDPLVHSGKIPARLAMELLSTMKDIQARAGEIILPLLLMHAGQDRLTAVDGSKFLHEKAGSTDKTLKIYPDLYHEIFNEPEQDEVLADMGVWLDKHMG